MLCNPRVIALTMAGAFALAMPLRAEDGVVRPTPRTQSLVEAALTSAWTPDAAVSESMAQRTNRTVVQRRYNAAGPNIQEFGLGGVAGLSDFEIGPSARYWLNDRFGLQAHLGFSGDDLPGDDADYVRFEPTFIVAIGDFGNNDVNVRPYVGGGLRLVRVDVGNYDDLTAKPVAVGGVEFGFRAVPRLKVSGELSLTGSEDFDDDFPFNSRPSFGGARVVGLVHYFFGR